MAGHHAYAVMATLCLLSSGAQAQFEMPDGEVITEVSWSGGILADHGARAFKLIGPFASDLTLGRWFSR